MPFILVADDSATDRKLIGGLLNRDIEWIVEFAEDGEAAMSMIEDVTPDLVVTDLQMPKLDGLELCRRSRGQFPQIPVVLVTGKGSEDLAVEALAAGDTMAAMGPRAQREAGLTPELDLHTPPLPGFAVSS